MTLRIWFNECPHPSAGVVILTTPIDTYALRGPNQRKEISYYLKKTNWHKFIGASIDGEELSLEELQKLVDGKLLDGNLA